MPTEGRRSGGRELVVVDASVIVSLLIDPGPTATAIATRLGDATLIAPAVLPFEVANVLRRRRNAGLLSPGEAAVAHDAFIELPVDLWPWEVMAARAWQLGDNLSSYDASYIALAELTNATLLTRDKRIAGAPALKCAVTVF
ncbi:type II toxin-antitoxin system VapC family toxin [Glaciibacter superstes]|uniref:type II toxin-antitoxin system VapC family toxin n=1 Tax=Glaciibacter superstes TaxID=501023 RepID=UPI0003B31AE7|nr:type II toxin-antitoxin system VapC family toxin [Glaciibacter superstes]